VKRSVTPAGIELTADSSLVSPRLGRGFACVRNDNESLFHAYCELPCIAESDFNLRQLLDDGVSFA
jgi:hypothetical protein